MGYTTNMSIFANATSAPATKSPTAAKVAIGLAAVMVMLVVAQLFTFEDFPNVIHEMAISGIGDSEAILIAALIVVGEVFAIPFLLGMKLSPLMRIVSMVLGWLIGLWWLMATIYQVIEAPGIGVIGLLGATISLPAESWVLLIVMSVIVLIVWASWGLWPIRRNVK